MKSGSLPNARLETILVVSELTVSGDASLRTAATLGRASGASVHILHSLGKWGVYGGSDAPGAHVADVRSALKGQRERTCGDHWIPSTEVIAVNPTVRSIARRAAEVDADMIVLARRPRRAWLDGLLGSRADRVLRATRRPCLMVTRPLEWPLRVVLVATDFSPPARRGVDLIVQWLAGSLSPGSGDPVLLLLCVSPIADPIQPRADVYGGLQTELAHIETQTEGNGSIRVEPIVYSAPMVRDGISRVARDRSADLVVLGTHAYHPWTRQLVGSVAAALMGTIDAPLLLVPPPAPPGA